jgi:signal transduction histidine kinase
MLDLDQMEADKVVIHLAPIDLSAALVEAVARARAASAKHVISVDIGPDLQWIDGDAVRISQLLGVLLDNAIKYSPLGGAIEVTCYEEPGQVVVSVVDHGLGMPPDFDGQIFARYQWSANNPTTKVMGTGLGLPMARQIVEMHGGRIWFESAPGLGSAFHFSVPVQTNSAAPRVLPALAAVGQVEEL